MLYSPTLKFRAIHLPSEQLKTLKISPSFLHRGSIKKNHFSIILLNFINHSCLSTKQYLTKILMASAFRVQRPSLLRRNFSSSSGDQTLNISANVGVITVFSCFLILLFSFFWRFLLPAAFDDFLGSFPSLIICITSFLLGGFAFKWNALTTLTIGPDSGLTTYFSDLETSYISGILTMKLT